MAVANETTEQAELIELLGEVGTYAAELEAYRGMLATAIERVREGLGRGLGFEELREAGVLDGLRGRQLYLDGCYSSGKLKRESVVGLLPLFSLVVRLF